jgi:excisionase family DNA binding protein
MGGPTLADRLTGEFYAWEVRGRGWATYPHPVALEPPFHPFVGHHAPPAVPDDGREHSRLSRLLTRLQSRPHEARTEPEEPEPVPHPGLGPEAAEFVVALPEGTRIARPALLGFLRALTSVQGPIAFEILGGAKRVELRLACARGDAPHLLGQLRAALPTVLAVEARETLRERWEGTRGRAFAAAEFGLASEFMVPLANRPPEEPLLAIIAALADLGAGELGLFQVLFEETRAPWAPSILRAVTTPTGEPFFADAPEITALAKEKIASPLFAVALRVASQAPSEERALEILGRLAGSLAQFGSPRTNELMPLAPDDLDTLARDLLDRATHRPGMLLSAEELLNFLQLPGAGVLVPELWRGGPRSKRVPAEVAGPGCLLGLNAHAGETRRVRLPVEAKTKHVHVVGGSGTGKSTLLVRMIVEDIKAGHGVGVLDPHGDLVDEVAARVPERRLQDVVLFDPSDEAVPTGWNILGAHSERERDLLASDLVGIFRRLATSWGDQMTAVLGNAILVFLESDRGGTLLDLRSFLVDDGFRKEMLATVTDPYLLSFWRTEFPLLVGRRPEAPILTRLDTFLRAKLVRRVVTAAEPTLDFQEVTEGGRIFLGKLAAGAIGEENAALLGSLLVSKFHQVTLAREAQAETARRPFFLYLDEFQEVATPSMAALFSGARKYRLGLTVAHQDLYQLHHALPEVERSLLGNAYTRIMFRVGEEDARTLARGLSYFTAEDLMALGLGHAICRVGGREGDFNLAVTPLPALDPREALLRREALRALSARRFTSRGEAAESEKPKALPAPTAPKAPEANVPPPTSPAPTPEIKGAPVLAKDRPPREPRLEKLTLDYLADLARSPFLSVRERNSALGLSAWRGQRVKSALLREGLAREVAINPGGRGERFKLLDLTAEGRAVLQSYGVAVPSGHGRGGLAHQWWVRGIAQWLAEHGLEARIEDASSGARVDLAFTSAGERIAVEIEMSEGHAAENVRKDLAAGYDRVVCLLDETVGLERLRTKLGPVPSTVLLAELRTFEAALAPLLPPPSPLREPNQNEERRRRRQVPPAPSAAARAPEAPPADPGAVSTPEAAAYLGLSPATLETLRTRGGGPPFVKLGRRVVYRREDLDAWLNAARRRSTSESP